MTAEHVTQVSTHTGKVLTQVRGVETRATARQFRLAEESVENVKIPGA